MIYYGHKSNGLIEDTLHHAITNKIPKLKMSDVAKSTLLSEPYVHLGYPLMPLYTTG